nr:SRPBCC family protein [Herpetosiphonaceae bacterium]
MASTTRDIPVQGPHGTQGLGHETTNIGMGERWISAVGGGALLAYGMLRRDRSSIATAIAGGTLVIRGLTGRSLLYRLVGFNQVGGTYPSVQKSKTINRSAEELFRYWRNFENLPRFMDHLQSVRTTGHKTSHWVAKAPLGSSVEWDAEIVDERPNELIACRSLPGADVYNAGSVRFEQLPEDRGTELHVTFEYNPPAGFVGALVAKLFGEEPNLQ